MKTIILFLSITPIFIFSQSKDLTKKEAYQFFKNSKLRKSEKISLLDFEKIYKTAKCVQKIYADKEHYPNALKLKTMPIFNNKIEKSSNNAIFSNYGYDLDIPKKDDNGNKTECL